MWLPPLTGVISSNAYRLRLNVEYDDFIENLFDKFTEVSELFHKKLQVQKCVLKESESHKSAGNLS